MSSKKVVQQVESNVRFAVNETTRLSISTFNDGKTAVAIMRYQDGAGWKVDGETAEEFYPKDNDADYAFAAASHYGSVLVADEIGEFPDRFYRDAQI